jgi:hypothetical protein
MTRSVNVINRLASIDVPVEGAAVSGTVEVAGWAVDLAASTGTGVNTIHIYRGGPAGDGVFVGAATYGVSRPDVAEAFGSSQFTNSGWSFGWNTAGLSGPQTLYVYARSTVTGHWQEMTRSVNVVN